MRSVLAFLAVVVAGLGCSVTAQGPASADRAAGSPSPVALTPEQQQWLQQHPVLRFGVNDFPPLIFRDTNGAPAGIANDYSELVARRLGVRIEWVHFDGWSEELAAVRAGTLDVAPSLASGTAPEDLLPGKPWTYLKSVIVMRRDAPPIAGVQSLSGVTIAVQRDSVGELEMRRRYPDHPLLVTESVPQILDAVLTGRSEAGIGTLAVLDHRIRDLGYGSTLKLAAPFGDNELPVRMLVASDATMLSAILDRGIDQVSDAERQAILQRWFQPPAETAGLDPTRVLRWALTVALPILAGIAFALYWVARLRREVRARKQLEQELRETQAQLGASLAKTRSQFQSILENAPMAIWAKDGDGHYLLANENYRQMFNLPKDAVIVGKRDEAFFSAEAARGFRANDRQVMVSGQTQSFVEPVQPNTAQSQTVLSVKFPLRDEQGSIYAAGGICVDVSEQMRLQEELKRTTSQLAAILDHAPAAIWAKDRAGRFLFANSAFHDRAHVADRHSVVGRLNSEVFDPHTAEQFRISDERIFASMQAERRIETRNEGERRSHSLNVKFPLVEDSGEVYAVGGISFDISEQIRLQEELKALNANLEQRVAERGAEADEAGRRIIEITDSLPGIVFELVRHPDQRYTVPFVSKGMLDMMGVDPELVRQDIAHFVAAILPEDRHILSETIESPSKDGNRVFTSFRIRHLLTGQVKWLLGTSSRHPRPDGTRLSRGFFTDITELKQLESELAAAREVAESAARTKASFLANMSHEIRTPMNAIIGMSHLALQTELDPRQLNYLSKIDSAARSLLGIVNDVLDVSKIEAGKLVTESANFSLQDLLDNLTMLLGQKVQEKGLELLFRVDPEIPNELVGDPLRLGQILTNFGSNAAKFTEQGEIIVSADLLEREDARVLVRFAVKDTGIGMSHDEIGRLFQAFEQADTSTTRRFGGTGLGLTIAKRLAEIMGGEVGVDSTQGHGSTFWFTARLGVQKDARPASQVTARDLIGKRVLVTDDNASAREILVSLVRSLGFEASACNSGAEALAELRRAQATRPYDLVVLDWKMPGLTGSETARQVRADIQLALQPAILMITGYGREDLADDLRGIKVDGLLVKPVNASALLDATMTAFGRAATPVRAVPAPALSTHAGLRGLRVLLVEDNEINQEIAAEILHQAGMVVTVAGEGREALARIRSKPFDIVLMDMQMPVMDGIAATRAIRSEPRFATLPILAMTANVMAEDIQRCLAVGMNDHVGKPIDVEELLGKLERWTRPQSDGEDELESRTIVLSSRSEHLPAAMDGLDLAVALKNMVGNRVLLRKLLLKFRDSHADTVERVRNSLAAGDRDAATRAAHTLKAVAGNIGARDLQTVAGDLELALRTSAPEENAVIERLQTQLARVVESIAALDARNEPRRDSRVDIQPEAMTAIDPQRLRPLLLEVQRRLDDNDIGAGEIVERLAALGIDGPALPLLRTLEKLVGIYDFDAATEALHRLASRLGVPLR